MKKAVLYLCTFVLAATLSVPAYALRYRVKNLGTLYGWQMDASAINDRGQIVGFAMSSTQNLLRAFVYNPGQGFTDLGTLGGMWSTASDINEIGWIVGNSLTSKSANHGFLYVPGKGMTDLASFGISSQRVVAVNNVGQIAGDYRTPQGNTHAFLYTPGAGVTDCGTLGGTESYTADVNDLGQVVGVSYLRGANGTYHGFLYTPGIGITRLAPAWSTCSQAWSINNDGSIAGFAYPTDTSVHAFVYSKSAGIVDLTPVAGMAYAVSNAGHIVGWEADSDETTHYFVDTPGVGRTRLDAQGVHIYHIDGINSRGVVVGSCSDSTGRWLAMWEPVPEINVQVDVKPGDSENAINLGGKGRIPVAILTDEDFSATDVDTASVEFARAKPVKCNAEDADGDGDVDLLCLFNTQDLDLADGDTEAVLIAEASGDRYIKGTDSVRVISPKK